MKTLFFISLVLLTGCAGKPYELLKKTDANGLPIYRGTEAIVWEPKAAKLCSVTSQITGKTVVWSC